MATDPQSVCQQVREITGWTDAQIGRLIDMSPATVEAYRLGYRTEYIDDAQMGVIRHALELYRTGVVEAVDRFLLFN